MPLVDPSESVSSSFSSPSSHSTLPTSSPRVSTTIVGLVAGLLPSVFLQEQGRPQRIRRVRTCVPILPGLENKIDPFMKSAELTLQCTLIIYIVGHFIRPEVDRVRGQGTLKTGF